MTGGRANIERLLREHPFGMTVRQITEALGAEKEAVRSALRVMPHVYVDRWLAVRTGAGGCVQWAAVYALADIPPDMPRPDRKPTEEDCEWTTT
jgi:hypothetical protein